ncbi:MAG: SufD family Fe-S cluster assembly protein [Eubacterium sp.]|nr:SufD family Fe-S cluster assembly protein [Eubacterium sp.]
MEKRKMTINHLPAYTYNWLHMNAAELADVSVCGEAAVKEEIPEGVQASVLTVDRAEEEGSPANTAGKEKDAVILTDARADMGTAILTGAGADMDALVADAGVPVHVLTAPAGQRITDDAARLSFQYANPASDSGRGQAADAGAEGSVSAWRYVLEPDSEMTVVMDYSSSEEASGFAAVQTKVHVQKDAVLHLVQIQRTGSAFTLINDVGGVCEEGGRVELIRLILSGKNTFDGCRVALEGEKSSLGVDIGYLARRDEHLDMNYDAYHTGKKTTSEMNISGVLRDRAFKLFRGTIDFQNGCSGAVGDELEDVMLMDSTVVNQTIPLILCAEEDVVGNHGATIGRLDDQLLFYMESRGMNREEVYEMMARARIDAVIRKIPDLKTKERLLPTEQSNLSPCE